MVVVACGGPVAEQLADAGSSATVEACEAGTATGDATAPVQDAAPAQDVVVADVADAIATDALWMPIDFLRGRSDVLLVWQGDSIANAQSQIVPFATGATSMVNVSFSGKTMATMDQDFADAERPALVASDASIRLASTNGGINDLRPGSGNPQPVAVTCAHLASWCDQAHDAGAKAIVFELQPVCDKILAPGEQAQYVACEDGLVDAGRCDYVIGRDMALVDVQPDGSYAPAMLSDCMHPTTEGAYRIVTRYARLVAELTDSGL